MPNPFPGMNPYLEALWPEIHSGLINALADDLNATLPPDYFASVEIRLVIGDTNHQLQADVGISRFPRENFAPTNSTATIDAPVLVVESEESEEPFLEIRAANQSDEPITVIEILSLANKQNGRGREEYLAKQRQLLRSEVNLLEIDLLRAGLPTLAITISENRVMEHGPYLFCLHRAWPRRFELWGATLRQKLPRVAVPLRWSEGDVVLDVQAALNRLYDARRLAGRLDYSQEPVPPLSPEDAAWADELLKAARRR